MIVKPASTATTSRTPKQGRGSIPAASRGVVKTKGAERTPKAPLKPSTEQNTMQPPSRRTSKYRGVTKHCRSGRWEAHIWVKENGRQMYLGGYETEETAAEAYDVAALKCKGLDVKTNFDKGRYAELMEYIDQITFEDLVMSVRRQSQGFARGSSKYRGVTHHPSGRWEARIGIPGSKHIYLGLFNEEDEAGAAYDKALVLLRGPSAATNFTISDYHEQLAEFHKLQQDILAEAARSEEEGMPEQKITSQATSVAIRKSMPTGSARDVTSPPASSKLSQMAPFKIPKSKSTDDCLPRRPQPSMAKHPPALLRKSPDDH